MTSHARTTAIATVARKRAPSKGGAMPAPPPGPDFSIGGQFIDWADRAELDERFPAWIEMARNNLNQDVGLCKWQPDPNDPIVRGWHTWWNKQQKAIRTYVGPHPGLKLTVRGRTDKGDGWFKCYVRFDRARPKAVRVAS